MTKRLLFAASGLLLEAVLGGEARAEPVAREVPTAGSVISTRVGEEIDFVEAPSWRGLETLQDVKAGDVVRTNALGQVAILFADQTQLRLGRNATLLVRELTPGGATRLELTQGRLFGRTPRGGTEVRVETPAATAAIRGTDWSMSVESDRSSLLVLDGAVEFSNPQGSVTVQAGEAATATLGQAPSKIVVVSTDLREQMLINISLRGAFEAFSPYALSGPSLRAAQARIETIPPDRRTAEDRVIAAELALDQAGRQAALQGVAIARQVPLTREQAARLTLIEAIVAGVQERYAEAARLFDQALPGLRSEQAAAARYQAYFARSLADPTRALTPPSTAGTDRISVVGQAITAAFLDSPDAAYAILTRAAPRFPDDPVFLATLAEAAMLVGDYPAAERAVDRAAALAPDDPEVLSARAGVRFQVQRDLDGALDDLQRAIAITPAAADLWNDLGLLQSERGANREAERAFLRAIELDPEDPVTRANYAVLLLDADRLREADAQIEAAFAADPSFEFGHFARGRQRLQSGDQPGAVDSLLRATTANPAFSQGLLLLGAAYAEGGDFTLADQALANAGRLDPNDPIVSQFRASLATFLYQADDAIRFAQDSVRQTRARGGAYASIAATRDFGSTLGGAYRALSLGAWGDYWSDVVFDPFDAGGYFDRAITGGPSPLLTDRARQLPGPDPVLNQRSFSDLLQGLLLDPMALVGPSLRPAFVRAPFTELDVGGGPVSSEGDAGYNATGTFQRLGTGPVPYSLLVSGTYDSLDPSYGDQDESSFTGLLGFGLQPTPNDRVVAFVNGARETGGAAFEILSLTEGNHTKTEVASGFLGWSHTFGYRNVLNAAVSSARIWQDSGLFTFVPVPGGVLPGELDAAGDQTTLKVGLSHMLGAGPLTLRFGAEGGTVREDSSLDLTLDIPSEFGGPVRDRIATDDATRRLARVWIDALAEVGNRLRVEAALFGTYLEDDPNETLLAPRIGLAFMPVEGHWLRAGYLRERPILETSTLAPIGLLGLDPIDLPQDTGQVDTTLVRWDAQWSRRFFTAVEVQHQEIDDLSFSVASPLDAIAPLVPLDQIGTIAAPEASLDRLQLSANLWITGGVGVFGTVARNWSDASLATGDGDIPFVPDVSARFGVTHVSPRLFTVTLAETYLGKRASNLPGQELDGAWTTDLTAGWESPSRRISLDLGVYNIFDEAYEIAPGLRGVGRTLTATLQARF